MHVETMKVMVQLLETQVELIKYQRKELLHTIAEKETGAAPVSAQDGAAVQPTSAGD